MKTEEQSDESLYTRFYRGMVHCSVCNKEGTRTEPHMLWPKCYGQDMEKGCTSRETYMGRALLKNSKPSV